MPQVETNYSLETRCKQNAADRLGKLLPTWLSDRRVKIVKRSYARQIRNLIAGKERIQDGSPMVLVGSGVPINVRRVGNKARRLEFPIMVTVMGVSPDATDTGDDDYTYFEELANNAFDQQPALGLDGVFKTHYTPVSRFPESAYANGWDLVSFRLHYHACERVT